MSRAPFSRCWAALALASTLGGCAVAPVRPDDAALQALPPQDRSALLVDGELVRIANLQMSGRTEPGLVALQAQGGRPVYTYCGSRDGFAGGKLADQADALLALSRARLASPFHRPVKAQAGQATLWFVHDLVPTAVGPASTYRSTLEVFDQEPRADATSVPSPEVVITLDPAAPTKVPGQPLLRPAGTVVELEAVALRPDGTLESVRMVPWRPTLPFMIQGKTSRDLWSVEDAATERILNAALLTWRDHTLPGWLREASPGALAQAARETEQGLAALDRAIGAASGEAGQLMRERQGLLSSILAAVKAAAAPAAGTRP